MRRPTDLWAKLPQKWRKNRTHSTRTLYFQPLPKFNFWVVSGLCDIPRCRSTQCQGNSKSRTESSVYTANTLTTFPSINTAICMLQTEQFDAEYTQDNPVKNGNLMVFLIHPNCIFCILKNTKLYALDKPKANTNQYYTRHQCWNKNQLNQSQKLLSYKI